MVDRRKCLASPPLEQEQARMRIPELLEEM
jgi:hypothetical protein